MLLREMTKLQKPSFVCEYNQAAIFLAKNRQVGICTKHIDIYHNFLQDVVKYKDIDVQYILIKYNPADIMTKNTSEADFAGHMKIITEG